MNQIPFPQSRKLDVIPLGRAALDFNPNEIHRPLMESRTFTKYLGGSPANIAVGLARLGKQVGFIGKVSADQFGNFVIAQFEREGVDVSRITRARQGEPMGLTFTEILSPVESRILMHRSGVADLQLAPEEIDEAYIKEARALVISGTALAASPSREACFTAMEYAKKQGTVIIFDIDYRDYTWRSSEEIAVYYGLAGRMSEIIIGSREEFDLMEKLMGGRGDDRETADRWLGQGNRIVVIKHGKEGSVAYTAAGQTFRVRPFPAKLLKSFGGGDAYASAFIYGLLEGWEVADALEFGSASAAMVVASHSCSEAMPDAAGIHQFIVRAKAEHGSMVTMGNHS